MKGVWTAPMLEVLDVSKTMHGNNGNGNGNGNNGNGFGFGHDHGDS